MGGEAKAAEEAKASAEEGDGAEDAAAAEKRAEAAKVAAAAEQRADNWIYSYRCFPNEWPCASASPILHHTRLRFSPNCSNIAPPAFKGTARMAWKDS